MEETTTWKNHSFTLLIFGGIIVLCAIFFALGMVVGRSHGRQIAESLFEARQAKKTTAEAAGDNFPLHFFDEATGDKQNFGLQPPPDPPARPREEPAASSKEGPSRDAAALPPKQPAKPAPTGSYLQVTATKSEKQANDELKKVKSKGFEATILTGFKDNVKWHRVVVGPYKESELSLAKKDLQAKGYKGAFVAK